MTVWESVEPLIDRTEQACWAPWTPELGTHVRVRLNGECTFKTEGMNGAGQIVSGPHFPDLEEGRSGVVVPCPYIARDGFCEHAKDSHNIVVRYDNPIRTKQLRALSGHYAVTELEPLP